MDAEFDQIYLACLAGSKNGFKNPPLFACVMREASFSLDCHAFACKCAEDAIVGKSTIVPMTDSFIYSDSLIHT